MAVSIRESLEARRLGKLFLHEFADGVVIERDRGRALAARYDEIAAALFEYESRSDNAPRSWQEWIVLLRFPDGSTSTVQGTMKSHALQRRLAARCGAGPRTVLTVDEVLRMRDDHRWQ